MKQCPACHLVYPNESTVCFVEGAVLATLRDGRLGTTIAGQYVIERPLGAGAMATVYVARYLLIERPCAIKILNLQCAQDPVLRERFQREVKHAQRIAHPNVIQIFDHGETEDGCPFLVMELLEGRSLADVIAEGSIPLVRAFPIAIEMIRALARAHDFEVYHRDLKPENVFLRPGDNVKLLDFGIARSAGDARITNRGEILGTPQYMAPERGHAMDSGAAGDLYAFGVVLFEMVTGRLPFEARSPASWLLKHMREPPPHVRTLLPSAPEVLDRLIWELMAKNPADRPADAHRVEATLVKMALAEGIPVPAETVEELVSSASKRIGTPWQRRLQLFERMLARAYPAGAPAELARAHDQLCSHLAELGCLRAVAFEEQQRLETIELEVREGRQRIGRAMDALSADASKTREEIRQLRATLMPLGAATKALLPPVMAAHKEALRWEGRSAFVEPYGELAAAYRELADRVDAWYQARQIELAAERDLVRREHGTDDVDFQIRSLRESLNHLERSGEERRAAIQKAITAAGGRAQQVEGELVQIAGALCTPLRSQPELDPLFNELEQLKF